jgi:hypothetical protein
MNKRAFGMMAVTLAVTTLALGAGLLKDPFAGTWKITATAEGQGKDFKDNLTFKGDKLTAEKLKEKGWEPGTYDSDTRASVGGMATFTATLKNEKLKGEMTFKGSVVAGQIKGEITVKVEGKPDEHYNFTGESVKSN